MKLFTVAMALVVSGAITASADSLQFQQLRDGVTQFVTPDQNIGCTYIPFDGANNIDTGQNSSELHCYILNASQLAVSLGVKGPARKLNVKGVLDCCAGGNVLPFGRAWSEGGYTCRSKRSALSCTFQRHGFSINRSVITRF